MPESRNAIMLVTVSTGCAVMTFRRILKSLSFIISSRFMLVNAR